MPCSWHRAIPQKSRFSGLKRPNPSASTDPPSSWDVAARCDGACTSASAAVTDRSIARPLENRRDVMLTKSKLMSAAIALTAFSTLAAVSLTAAPAEAAVVYCKTAGVPQGCVVRSAPVVVAPVRIAPVTPVAVRHVGYTRVTPYGVRPPRFPPPRRRGRLFPTTPPPRPTPPP